MTGDASDFVNQVTLLNGEVIDMETYGLGNAIYWHAFWILAGTAWLLWWLRRPLFIQRYEMLADGREDELVTETDKNVAKMILVGVAVVVLVGYLQAQSKHPNAIPLQAARDQIEPLQAKVNNGVVDVKVKSAAYQVPDRAMVLKLKVTNNSDTILNIGELAVANVRFINAEVINAGNSENSELVAAEGLKTDTNTAIAPGETRLITVTAQDAAWETQRLDGLIKDADSRMGGLLFLYGPDQQRHIVSISASVIPKYIS